MCLYDVCSSDPHQVTYQSKLGVQLRKRATYNPSTLYNTLYMCNFTCFDCGNGVGDPKLT